MVMSIDRPRLEGNISVGEGRRIGFAEFGAPRGRAVSVPWNSGACRQTLGGKAFADRENIRLIGGTGRESDRPRRSNTTMSWVSRDLQTIADTLGVDEMAVVGLSGGGPYTSLARRGYAGPRRRRRCPRRRGATCGPMPSAAV